MKTVQTFETKPEAEAFIHGVTFVGDLDVDVTPIAEFNGQYAVTVSVGAAEEEDETEEVTYSVN
jgi:hypothetical protein